MTKLVNCPKCNSEYVYEDEDMLVIAQEGAYEWGNFICKECAYEWKIQEDESKSKKIAKNPQ